MGCVIEIIRNQTNPEEIDAQITKTTDPETELISLGKPEHAIGRLRWLQIKDSACFFGISALGVTFMGLGSQRIASAPEEWRILHVAFGFLEIVGGMLIGYYSALEGVDNWKKLNKIKQNVNTRIASLF